MSSPSSEPTPSDPASSLSPLAPRPSLGLFLRIWFTLGLQSFGGGVVTLSLIRRAAVEEQGWLDDIEFSRLWALVQLAPGINLLAITILIGRRVAGGMGVALALLGLLLPSVAVTILLTAVYARIENAPLMRAALRGILPAVLGVGLLTALSMIRPMLIESYREGQANLAASVLILFGSAAAFLWLHWGMIQILFVGAVIGGASRWLSHAVSSRTEGEPK